MMQGFINNLSKMLDQLLLLFKIYIYVFKESELLEQGNTLSLSFNTI